MDNQTKQQLSKWIGSFPESGHPFDEERFYELIFQCLKNEDYIDSDDIKNMLVEKEKKWSDDYMNEFALDKSALISRIISFVDFLKEKKKINIYNQL